MKEKICSILYLFMSLWRASHLSSNFPTSFTYDGIGYLSDSENDWLVGRTNKPKCIDIPNNLTLCRNIGYTRMRLPNLLQHDTINEVIQQSKSWTSLHRIHCHPDTQLFLCSLFSPVCLERTIFPCRSLCESVKAGCERKMNHYGYLWPDMVRCDKFPEDVDLCIQPLHNITAEQHNACEPCNQPSTLEGMVDNLCRAEFVARVKIRRVRVKRQHKVITLKKKKKFYKTGTLTKRERRKLSLVIHNGANCECDDIANGSTTKYIVMGNKTGSGRMNLTYIGRWRNDREFKRALRKIRTFDCSKIVAMIEETGDVTNPPPRQNDNTRRRNGNGKRRRGDRKRRKNRKNRKNKRKKGGRRNGSKGRRRSNNSATSQPNSG